MQLRFSIRARPGGVSSGPGAPVIECVVTVPFAHGEAVVGRGRDATIELPFPAISSRHARVFRDVGGYRVEDLGSANGTLLGGRRLVPHVAEAIAVGDVVEVAGVELRFEGERAAEEPGNGSFDSSWLGRGGDLDAGAPAGSRPVHGLSAGRVCAAGRRGWPGGGARARAACVRARAQGGTWQAVRPGHPRRRCLARARGLHAPRRRCHGARSRGRRTASR